MAAAAQSIRPPAIRLSYSVPQRVALRSIAGRTVPSKFPDALTGAMEQVAFELADGAPLYLSFEDASALEHQLLELGIRAGADFRLTKVKMPRGGGSALRVERASDPEPYRGSRPDPPAQRTYRPAVAASDAEIEAKLAESVRVAGESPAEWRDRVSQSRTEQRRGPSLATEAAPTVAVPAPVALSLHTRVMIEQLAAAKAFATSLDLSLTTDDLRSLVITTFIHEARR